MSVTGRTSNDADAVILALATRQHGVVTRAQLLSKGVGRRVIDRWIAKGLLRQLHRGVYQVGPIAAPRAREMAACLACGSTAVLGHRSAAVFWKLLTELETPGLIDVIVRGRERRHRGIRVHRTRTLGRGDWTKLDGIPVTKPGRTLCDLASSATERELEQALAVALARRLTTRAQLARLMSRASGRRGTVRLSALLAGPVPAMTRSEAEERVLALVRRARLPDPEMNVRVAGFEVDFLWRDLRLVAEVDGFAFHADANAFENDRRRDLALTSAGYRVVRITWRQIVNEPEAVIAQLAQALVHRG